MKLSNRGGVLLFLLITSISIAVVTGGLVSFVSSYVQSGFKTQDLISKKLVLNGFMDYTLIALKQRWCFTSDWQRDTPTNCTLMHPRNAERLFMREKSAKVLKDLGIPMPTPLSSKGFSVKIETNQITGRHPLSEMSDLMIRSEAKSISINVKRVENKIIASQGDETYIKVFIELAGVDGKTSSIEALTAFFPREVASFALIANNLDLAQNIIQPPLVRGVASIPVTPKTFTGLKFDSPVFINKNVNLPKGTFSGTMGSTHSPVVFLAPLVMGSGKLTEEHRAFTPQPPDDQLLPMYGQAENFRGFKAGIQTDGQLDRGLSVLVGDSSAKPVDLSLTDLCIERNNYLSNLAKSKRSELVLRQVSNSGEANDTTARYLLSFSELNEFKQFGSPRRLREENDRDYIARNELKSSGDKRSIMELEIEFEDYRSETRYRLARGSEILIQAGGTSYSIRKKIDKLEYDLRKENDRLTGLNRLKGMFVSYENLQNEIDVLENISNPTKEQKDELKQKKKDAKKLDDDIEDLADDLTGDDDLKHHECDAKIASTKVKITQLERDLVKQKAIRDNPPVITAKTKAVEVNGKSHPGLVELELKITNSQYLDIKPRIKLEGYDVAYEYKHGDLRSIRNGFTRSHGFSTYGEIDLSRNSSNQHAFEQLDPAKWYSASLNYRNRTLNDPPIEDRNLFVLCEADSEDSTLPQASWDIDFSPYAFHSWSFTNKHQDNTNISFGNNDAYRPGRVEFNVRSIMNRCRVRASANFLVGFFHCKEFIIEQRNSPLRIIGTVIAHAMTIHRSALEQGIHWSSVYHPEAVKELRAPGVDVLKPHANIPTAYRTCVPSTTIPVWHPSPSPYAIAARYGCNASSLRAKADPFSWNMLDPDCAKLDSGQGNKCKRHIKRFIIKQYGRTLQL